MKFILPNEERVFPEPEIKLGLKRGGGGYVYVTAEKPGEPAWNLLRLEPNGTIEACEAVPRDLSFEVRSGKVVVR